MGTVNGTKNVGLNQQGPTLNINGGGCSGCSWFNIICVVMRKCIWDAIKRILVLLAIVVGIVLAGVGRGCVVLNDDCCVDASGTHAHVAC